MPELPSIGRKVRVVAKGGRIERQVVGGVFTVEAGELRLEADRTGRSWRVAGAWLRVPAGWCPVHRDAEGPYVRAFEAEPFVPLANLFGQGGA